MSLHPKLVLGKVHLYKNRSVEIWHERPLELLDDVNV